jgi:RHS repeat-associated protein
LWGTKQDELICDNDNWTLGDHLNTIRDIVKSDGAVTDHLEYNSFGKIISATKNDSSLRFAYTGKLTDNVSELQWNINRWYNAKVGRWVSEDPIGFKSGDRNFYRYVKNTVCGLYDAFGLTSGTSDWCKDLCTLGSRKDIKYAGLTFRAHNKLSPESRDAGLDIARNGAVLSTLYNIAGIGLAYASGDIPALVGQIAQTLTDQAATGNLGTNLINASQQIEDAIMKNQGFNIWVKMNYKECSSHSCFYICLGGWPQLRYGSQTSKWYSCSLNGIADLDGGVMQYHVKPATPPEAVAKEHERIGKAVISCIVEGFRLAAQ